MASNPAPKEGKRYRFKHQLYWALNGRVAIEDQRTGEFKTIRREDLVARYIAYNAILKNPRSDMYPDERSELYNTLSDMAECNKECKAQGDPHMPGVIQQVAKENRVIQVGFGSGDTPVHLRPTSKPKIFLPGMRTHESPTFRELSIDQPPKLSV